MWEFIRSQNVLLAEIKEGSLFRRSMVPPQIANTYLSITIKVVSSNPVHGEVYGIQYYLIKLSVTCSRSVVFSTNKTDHQDITVILLKVASNIINLTIFFLLTKLPSLASDTNSKELILSASHTICICVVLKDKNNIRH